MYDLGPWGKDLDVMGRQFSRAFLVLASSSVVGSKITS